MKFNEAINSIEEGKFGKAAAGLSLIIALLAGGRAHQSDLKKLDLAQNIIATELSSEIRNVIPTDNSKKSRQAAFRSWEQIVQDAKEENPELRNYPDLYRAGQAIIMNPSLI